MYVVEADHAAVPLADRDPEGIEVPADAERLVSEAPLGGGGGALAPWSARRDPSPWQGRPVAVLARELEGRPWHPHVLWSLCRASDKNDAACGGPLPRAQGPELNEEAAAAEDQFGAPKAAPSQWASCVRVVDPAAMESCCCLEMDGNEAATSVALVPFATPGHEGTYLAVGTAQGMTLYPRGAQGAKRAALGAAALAWAPTRSVCAVFDAARTGSSIWVWRPVTVPLRVPTAPDVAVEWRSHHLALMCTPPQISLHCRRLHPAVPAERGRQADRAPAQDAGGRHSGRAGALQGPPAGGGAARRCASTTSARRNCSANASTAGEAGGAGVFWEMVVPSSTLQPIYAAQFRAPGAKRSWRRCLAVCVFSAALFVSSCELCAAVRRCPTTPGCPTTS